ncbi:MAG TPA: RluA family pseudouridine synthase [Candidatus Omnitrophica bacterium]|nr:RluA family pseudouridine synthase [Candidatus Omnitrophota bacterium]
MIQTIYEDDYILVIDKPSGLLTVPTPRKEKNTLTSILNKNLNKKNIRLYPCHRLDRDTSGLIIYAKSKKIQQAVMDDFRKRKVKKEYIAFVRGVPKKTGEIKSYIRRDLRDPLRLAETHYCVINQFKDFAQVHVLPKTGRTNQIRIHFKQIGHPLLGERRFAYRRDFKIKFKRTALHASRLEFFHPVTKKKLSFYSALPLDLKSLIQSHS